MTSPLSGEGIFGPDFEKKLKDRQEKDKQLSELMPEINKKQFMKRKSNFQAESNAKKARNNDDSYRSFRNNSSGGSSSSFRRSFKQGSHSAIFKNSGKSVLSSFRSQGNRSKRAWLDTLPEIPVAGRLRFFLPQWEKITNDQWVLSTIKEGLKLEFLSIPPFSGVKETHVNVQNLPILLQEVKKLLEKSAIEPVPLHDIQRGFYSTIFLVPKKTGDLRPVINLRSLNRYLKKQHFKMDSLNSVLNLVQQGDWAISLDLKDAYMHIPIHPGHKKFLRFCIQGKVYQFTCLCFGPTVAPRAFTKVVTVIAAHLRMRNIHLAVYLDDWFLVNLIRKILIQDKKRTLNLLVELGFMINLEKSALEPSQSVVYIGAHSLLAKGLVCPTLERIEKIKEACKLIRKNPQLKVTYIC